MRRHWEPGWWRHGGVTSAFLIVGVVLTTRSSGNAWHCVRVVYVRVRVSADAVRGMCVRVYHVCAVLPAGFSRSFVWIHAHTIPGVPVCMRHAETEGHACHMLCVYRVAQTHVRMCGRMAGWHRLKTVLCHSRRCSRARGGGRGWEGGGIAAGARRPCARRPCARRLPLALCRVLLSVFR